VYLARCEPALLVFVAKNLHDRVWVRVVRRGRVREDENGGPEVEQLLSRAYIPLLTHLVDVFANGLPPRKLEKLLREAGRMLAADLSPSRPAGPLKTRVTAISVWLNEQLGATTHVEENGGYVIRGEGCPLSALTGKHPIVCQAMESLVEDIVGAPARQCCDRADRPRCCFHIGPPSTSR
jgi:DeoR family transcriptional regulator, suf operon transcriptional repressor